MSLDLVVLTPGSAPDYDRALRVYREEDPGEPDPGAVETFAAELNQTFGERNWPFAGDPIVTPAYVLLTVAHEAWEETVPGIVESAHRHRLVVLDPQWEKLFPPGTRYDLDAADENADEGSQALRLEMTVHPAGWNQRGRGRRARHFALVEVGTGSHRELASDRAVERAQGAPRPLTLSLGSGLPSVQPKDGVRLKSDPRYDLGACYGETPWPSTCSSRAAWSPRSGRESSRRLSGACSKLAASPSAPRSSIRT